ncbi:MAG: polymerase sporulation sigma factor SigH [Bacillales bacterium]|jgi:RNA polymerase sporulation-specific sigma factor|nr:polymerase sporulation sigma factor SigH [Bacillales bacterium]
MSTGVEIRSKTDYDCLSDEQIVTLIQAGDCDAQDFLIQKYAKFVRKKVKPFYLVGATKEDVIQEGMIGLFKAIRDYNDEKKCSFINFADVCITRHAITAVKSASRKKHTPLNTYVSLDKPMMEEEEVEKTLIDVLVEIESVSPEEIVLLKEQSEIVNAKVNEALSDLEKQVLILKIEEKSYQEIADILDCPLKSVDNSVQRIKKKLDKIFNKK